MEKIVRVEVEKPVEIVREVERVITVEVEKETIVEIEVEKETIIEVEKPVFRTGAVIKTNTWFVDHLNRFAPYVTAKTGITMDNGTYSGDFWGKLLAELVAGQGPDVIVLHYSNWADFWTGGFITPFDDYFKAHDLNRLRFADDPWEEMGFDGQLMGISLFAGTDMGVWLDMDMVERFDLGADLPTYGKDNFDQWTADDMIEWADEATQLNSDGDVEIYGWQAGTNFGWWDSNKHWVASNNASWYEDPWDYRPSKTLINSPECVDALETMFDLVDRKITPDRETWLSGVSGGGDWLFVADKAVSWSFVMNTSMLSREIYQKMNLGFISFPYFQNRTHQVGGGAWGINKNSPIQDEVAEWITAFTIDDQLNRLKLDIWAPPPYDTRKYVDGQPEGTAKTINLINLTRSPSPGMSPTPDLAEDVVRFPAHAGIKSGLFHGTMGKFLNMVHSKEMVMKQALDAAADEINAEFAKGYDS
jgi:ABC-type glycerol-3-phosphate transport system substrate-binding protein